MKNKMGYLLILIGFAIMLSGFFVIIKTNSKNNSLNSNNQQQKIVKNLLQPNKIEENNKQYLEKEYKNDNKSEIDTAKTSKNDNKLIEKEIKNNENYIENKSKGDSFEKFVVKNFDKKYFTLQEWRGDKYVEGIYAISNHFPDLEIIFDLKSKGVRETFAIECKWRNSFFQGYIEWAKDFQLKNYKEYAEKIKIPVFILIGVGGVPENPNDIYIIPLTKMKKNIVSEIELVKYKKETIHNGFYWDYNRNELK